MRLPEEILTMGSVAWLMEVYSASEGEDSQAVNVPSHYGGRRSRADGKRQVAANLE